MILMDIQMPVMGGFDATTAIRGIEADRNQIDGAAIGRNGGGIPIIAMTAHVMGDYKALCLDAGMDDYLSKPLLRKDLIAMVHKWTSHRTKCDSRDTLPADDMPMARKEAFPPGDSDDPMNYEKALAEFMGKKDLLQQLLVTFLTQATDQITLLRQAVIDNDSAVIKKHAHTIKGGAANLTAMTLSQIAFELETCGTSGDLKEADRVLNRLETEFSRLKGYLEDRQIDDICMEKR